MDCFKVEFKFPWETMVNDLIKLSMQRQYHALMNGFAVGKRQMIDLAAPRIDPGRRSGITEAALRIAQQNDYHVIVDDKIHHIMQINPNINIVNYHFIGDLVNSNSVKYIGIRIQNVKGVVVDASAMDGIAPDIINDAIYRVVKDNGYKVIPMIILG